MAVYQGTTWVRHLHLKDEDGVAVNINGWTFRAHIRDNADDTTELLELTTAGGGFAVVDPENGEFTMTITAAQSVLLPEGTMVFDILRTDPADGPYFVVAGKFKVRQPVTRD